MVIIYCSFLFILDMYDFIFKIEFLNVNENVILVIYNMLSMYINMKFDELFFFGGM